MLLLLLIGSSSRLWGQSPNTYEQTHHEVEMTYGVVAPESYSLLNDIEKIKYQLRYTQRTVYHLIDGNTDRLEITIDSTNTEEPWMKLAKRFKYSDVGIDIVGRDGNTSRHIEYTEKQKDDRLEQKQRIAENGYHPGLVTFPELNEGTRKALIASGSMVEDVSPTVVKISTGTDQVTTIDSKMLTITEEWMDEDGLKNTELRAYEPYETDKGFLLVMLKHERIRYSENGPCITEVKLKYYSQYTIQDLGRYIDKATHSEVLVSVYPNPNSGIFQISITGPASMVVQRIDLVNLVTGEVEIISNENKRSLSIDKSQLPAGNYAIRVQTNTQPITTSFYKQ